MKRVERKGFYFSFDALLALSVLGLSLVFLLQTSSPITNTVDATVSAYRQTNTHAEDSVQLAIHSTMKEAFPQAFRDDYVQDTVLEQEDMEKSVLDVITILWASNETKTAANITQEYFQDTIPEEYEFQLSVLDDTDYLVYNTSDTADEAANLANAKRVVSGVQKNRPQDGYLARARAVEVEKNESRVLTFSPMGGANDGGKMNIWKRFNVNDSSKVVNTTAYIAVHYGCANNQFENLKFNGDNFKNEIVWLHQQENCTNPKSGTGAYGVVHNLQDYVVNGTNTIYARFRNNQKHAHTHPGMKIEMELRQQGKREFEGTVKEEQIFFDEIETTEQGNDNSGAFAVKPFHIPEGATVRNVMLHLEAEQVDRVYNDTSASCGTPDGTVSDVMVYFNGEKIRGGYAPGSGNVMIEENLTGRTRNGTNVVAAYFNTFGDCFWGSDETHFFGGYNQENTSYINVSYELSKGDLIFGKIELTRNEHIGGPVENPKKFNKSFNGSPVLSSYLHVAQLLSDRVTINVTDGDGNENNVFQSVGAGSVPSSIFIDPAFYTGTGNNTIFMEDETSNYDFVPESSFQYTSLVPSQVGYGGTFPNRSAALKDAKQRLNNTLGPYVDSTKLSSTSLSVNNVPWLFGPVTVEMEVWREDE